MKKYLMILVLLVFLSSMMISSQGINILTPKDGQVFFQGQVVNITTSTNYPNIGHEQLIFFSEGGSPQLVEKKIIPAQGTEIKTQYRIPLTGGIGKYVLRVRILSAAAFDAITFWVKEKPELQVRQIKPLAVIKVISPSSDMDVKMGKPVQVRWNNAPQKYPYVKVELVDQRRQKKVIFHQARNTGKVVWTPPVNKRLTNRIYSIRISTPDNKYFGISGKFRLIK